ncbi:DUF4352 domain-containing protein [Brevibacillus sp. B_LB10_24]|uniref:DUF4352 domain-containing protein n=1 Tax=Brevibacillus sp. B_LB10_24 TaxID=3380645 RepID=UPI0038BA8902
MEKGAKKPLWKKWWFWLIVVIVIAAIGSNGAKDDAKLASTTQNQQLSQPEAQPQQQKQAQQTEQQQQDTQQEQKAEEFKVGDVVQMGDYKLAVDEVKKSAGSDFDKPKDGMEYVIVKVTIENGGSKNISYNPFDFKMSNSQGQITSQAFTTVDNNTSLQSGELAPGGKVSGTIAFEQPKDDQQLQLQYKPSLWSDKTIKINLQ